MKVAAIFFSFLKNWRWTDVDVGDWMLNGGRCVAGVVDFGCKLVQRDVAGFGDGAEGIPELRLQRHAGAVAMEG